MTTHAHHAELVNPSTRCSAHHAKIGGGCFNCGWEPATIGTRVKVANAPPSRTWAKPESWAQIKNASGIIKRVRTRPGEPTTFLFVPDPERTEERTNTGNDGWWLSEDEFETIKPERCPHGIRYPHECRECADAIPQADIDAFKKANGL